MKKLFIIGLLVALLLIAMPAMAHMWRPADNRTFSRSDYTVGDVTVCNDETNLYVTFTTTGNTRCGKPILP